MKNCEHHEILLSSWLDGQLERDEQIECLDHLVRCSSCRDFYVEARALEGLVAAVRTPAGSQPPSPEVWKRIEWIARGEARRPAARRIPVWARQVAAVLIVGLGITLAVWNGGLAPKPRPAELVLGQGSNMSEARFVELTKEVLRAEPRYRSAMYQIMQQVVRDTTPNVEASFEEDTQRSEERGATEAVEVDPRRIPA